MQRNPQALIRLDSIEQKLDCLGNRVEDIYTICNSDLELGQPLLPKEHVIDIDDELKELLNLFREFIDDPFTSKPLSMAHMSIKLNDIIDNLATSATEIFNTVSENSMKISHIEDHTSEIEEAIICKVDARSTVLSDKVSEVDAKSAALSDKITSLSETLTVLTDKVSVVEHNTTVINAKLDRLFSRLFPKGDREWEAVGPIIFE